MAIAVDQASIGTLADDTAGSTIVLTTTASVASGGFIVVCCGWLRASITLSSVTSSPSLTWTIDAQGNATDNIAIASAQAPSGFASGSTITANLSGSADGARSIAGISFTGVKTSSPVDGTPPAVHTHTSTTAWTSNSLTVSAGSVVVGTSHETTSNYTSTATSPSTEFFDINGGAGSFSQTGAYRIESSSGSVTVAGTWSTANDGLDLAVAYLAAAGGAADIPALVMAPPIPT